MVPENFGGIADSQKYALEIRRHSIGHSEMHLRAVCIGKMQSTAHGRTCTSWLHFAYTRGRVYSQKSTNMLYTRPAVCIGKMQLTCTRPADRWRQLTSPNSYC